MTGLGLRVAGLSKAYGDAEVLKEVDLQAAPGELLAVLGPSGSGKSTLLQILAGLLDADAGEVQLGGRPLVGPAEHRPTGMVFQKPLLFPHLSVGDNVGFGLRMRGIARPDRVRQVSQILLDVGLNGFADRRVRELSGGQEQRVALARALVLTPALLLLDEPFSQLDQALREEIRDLVLALHRRQGLTTVLVTHDQQEAALVADRVALLLDGRVRGCGAPEELFLHPPSLAAARFLGASVELAGVVRGEEVVGQWGRLPRPPGTAASEGDPVVLVLREEHLTLEATPGSAGLTAMTESVRFAATYVEVVADLPGHGTVRARAASGGRQPVVGRPVLLHLQAGAGHELPDLPWTPG